MSKHFKKFTSLLLSLLMIVSIFPFSAVISHAEITGGDCGDNVTWSYDDQTGTLTISGSGEMNNYSSSDMPWYSFRSKIQSVIIESGVSSIGDYAFFICSNLTSTTIPEGVTSIGESAFSGCLSLNAVYFSLV